MSRIFFGSLIIFMEINKDTELQMCKCFENVAVHAQYLLLKQSNSHYVYPPRGCIPCLLEDAPAERSKRLQVQAPITQIFVFFLIENTYQLHSQNRNFFFSIFFLLRNVQMCRHFGTPLVLVFSLKSRGNKGAVT